MKFHALIAIVLVAGCATPYQQEGFRGGYDNERLGRGMFFISVKVNSFSSRSLAMRYFHRRAAELCRGDGYLSYQVQDRDADTRYVTHNGNDYAKPEVSGSVRCTEPAQACSGPPGACR